MSSFKTPSVCRFQKRPRACRHHAHTVPAGTQELEVAGFIRERSSIAGDCDQIPETILDTLEEDLERPSRRLVLVGGGSTPLAAGHTAGEHLNSAPVRSDICGHKRFRCGKPTSELHMVSQESSTTVEVDWHTIHPC